MSLGESNTIELKVLEEGSVDAAGSKVVPQLGRTPNEKKHCHPLSQVHLRIIAWGFQFLGHVGGILEIVISIVKATRDDEPEWTETVSGITDLLAILQNTAVSLFLIANFSGILRKVSDWKSLILQYAILALAFLLVWCYLYFHFGVGLIMFLTDLSFTETVEILDSLAALLFSYLQSFAIFVDMFLYTVLTFFLIYKPAHPSFHGRTRRFRMCALIPLAYLVGATVVRAMHKTVFTVPGYLWPLLPSQPLAFTASFCLLLVYLKYDEHRFKKAHFGSEDYTLYRLSSHGVYRFSRFTSLILLVTALVDVSLKLILRYTEVPQSLLTFSNNLGIGKGFTLLLGIPFIMLFNYAKESGSLLTSILIPAVGISSIIVLYLETSYTVIRVVLPLYSEIPLLRMHEDPVNPG